MSRARKPTEHGTRTEYVHHGCRCAVCRASNNEYQRQLRALKARLKVKHGTANGYRGGCRCGLCQAAHPEDQQRLVEQSRLRDRKRWANETEEHRAKRLANSREYLARWRVEHPEEHRARHRRYAQTYRQKHPQPKAPRVPKEPKKPRLRYPKHGTTSGYTRGCRCESCSRAMRIYQREWARQHPDVTRHYRKIRKWRQRVAAGTCSREQLAARWAYYGGKCWMCGAPATETDHVIPLSRGGSNWPVNLRPACGPCNSKKGAKVA
jgi:hypothetical protein